MTRPLFGVINHAARATMLVVALLVLAAWGGRGASAQEVFMGPVGAATNGADVFTFAPGIVEGSTQMVFDVAGDGGYLTVFIDFNGGPFDDTDRVINDQAVDAERVVLDLDIPAGSNTGGVTVKARVCLTAGDCNQFVDVVPASGEEENTTITVLSSGAAGAVDITDVDNGGLFEFVSPLSAGLDTDGDLVVTDGNADVIFSGDLQAINELDFAADDLTLDFTNGIPLPILGANNFVGTDVASALTLTQTGTAQTVNDIVYTYENDNDGTIDFDSRMLEYDGLLPIYESLVAGNKTFTYPNVNEASLVAALTFQPEGKVIRLTPDGDGASGNGSSFIDCELCGEETHFLNPTATLTINAGAGIDSVYVAQLDDVIPASFTTLNVNGGDRTTGGVTPLVDFDHDYISVVPSAAYEINVDGGEPTTGAGSCESPDVLDLNYAGSGASLTFTDFDDGEGVWTFSSGQADVNFTDIEIQSDQVYSVDVQVTPELVYATDEVDIMVSVLNNSAHPIRCLQVDLPEAILALGDPDPAVDGGGSLYADGGTNYFAPDTFVEIDQFGAETVKTFDLTIYKPDLYPGGPYALDGSMQGVLQYGNAGNRLDPGHTVKLTWAETPITNYELMPEVFDVRARIQTTVTGHEDIGGDRYRAGMVLGFDHLETSKGFYFPAKSHVNTALFVDKTLSGVSYEQLIVGIFQGAPGIDGAIWCRVPLTITGVWTPPAGTLGGDESLHWRPCSGADVADDPGTPAVDESRIALPFPLHPNKLFLDSSDTLWLATWGSAGLYKSEDFGETWQAAWPQLGPGNASIGAYWTNVYTITENMSNNFLYISANDGYLFHSLNGGDTWQRIGSLPHVDADTPWSLLSNPMHDNVLYAGTFGRGVYVSDDYGFTWQELTTAANIGELDNENTDLQGEDAGHIFDMVINDAGERLLVGTGNGVWGATIDAADGFIAAGEEWEFLGHDVELDSGTIVTPEIRSLAYDATNDVLVAGAWGAFLSENRRTVSAFKLDMPFAAASAGSPGDNNDGFEDLALRGVQVSFIAVSPSGQIVVGDGSGALVSLDTASASTSTANEDDVNAALPESYALGQNYPNPFNPVTTIAFDLPATGNVRLAVYDVLGREVALLVSGSLEAGNHQVRFDAQNLPSGSYLYRLDTDKGSFTRQLVLMK
ncbi:MAG: T9SS type A sorting domain-containing protein [Rhodothermales bacterium]|nr:T9SS type A sorting domain-containing protein [Rhodothermales bacterium]